MTRFSGRTGIIALLACGVFGSPTSAFVHRVQIEQAIGGIDGDATLQAVQFRMRRSGENLFQYARLHAWDAAGENPVLVIDFKTSVPNDALGDRVLLVGPDFIDATSPSAEPDFVTTNLIPASYLEAGSLTFEFDPEPSGSIIWRLSWGGDNYTGPTGGGNDDDGDAGPPFPGPLPSEGTQALQFQGDATALSTTNADDYALTSGAAVFTNNAADSFTVVGAVAGDLNADGRVDLADFVMAAGCLGGPDEPDPPAGCDAPTFAAADFDEDLDVDLFDVAKLATLFGFGVP